MREMTYAEAAREGLAEEMARDPSVFVVGEGIGARGGNFNTTAGLYELYGPEALARYAHLPSAALPRSARARRLPGRGRWSISCSSIS